MKDARPGGDAARVERATRSFARSRLVFATLAFVVPGILHGLFERQARRLDALAHHGVAAEATVTRVVRQSGSAWTEYAYEVAGVRHTWSVAPERAPTPGETFAVVYLPELPSFSRPGKDGSGARAEAAGNRASNGRFLAGAFGFFTMLAVFSEGRLRQFRRNGVRELTDPSAMRARVLLALGVVVGPLLLAVTAFHVSDAKAKGESLWPVGLGAAFALTVLGLVMRFAMVDHAATGGRRLARFQEAAALLAASAAAVRLVVWLVG